MAQKGALWSQYSHIYAGRILKRNDGTTGVALYPAFRNLSAPEETLWEVRWDTTNERERIPQAQLKLIATESFAENDLISEMLQALQKNNFEPLPEGSNGAGPSGILAPRSINVPAKGKRSKDGGKGKAQLGSEPAKKQKAKAQQPKEKEEVEDLTMEIDEMALADAIPRRRPSEILAKFGDFVPGPTGRQYPKSVCIEAGDKDESEEESGGDFEVTCIVDEAKFNNVPMFLVKWKGYTLDIGEFSEDGKVMIQRGHWEPRAHVKENTAYENWRRQKPQWFLQGAQS